MVRIPQTSRSSSLLASCSLQLQLWSKTEIEGLHVLELYLIALYQLASSDPILSFIEHGLVVVSINIPHRIPFQT